MSCAFVLGVRECDADCNVQSPHTARVYLTAEVTATLPKSFPEKQGLRREGGGWREWALRNIIRLRKVSAHQTDGAAVGMTRDGTKRLP